MRFDITCSIVLHNNEPEMLKKAIHSFLSTDLNVKLYLIDNSSGNNLSTIVKDDRVEYFHNPSNPGFGAGHNVAINSIGGLSEYHLILNPDIYFSKSILEDLIRFMESDKSIGIAMPKILYPDGKLQRIGKLLPSPLNFMVRRFLPFKFLKKIIDDKFELKKYNYDYPLFVPFLSGCFMFCRTEVLVQINGFDEKIFLFTEDIDLCRRSIEAGYQTVIYPNVNAYHDHAYKSFRSFKMFAIYLKSAIYYFNKWGWIFDRNRKNLNKRTLSKINNN